MWEKVRGVGDRFMWAKARGVGGRFMGAKARGGNVLSYCHISNSTWVNARGTISAFNEQRLVVRAKVRCCVPHTLIADWQYFFIVYQNRGELARIIHQFVERFVKNAGSNGKHNHIDL
jgi:hypothetical protein